MKTRDLKSQIKTKQKKIHSGNGFPGKSEGQDGDLTIRYVSGRGLFLCHKRAGKWYTCRFSEKNPTTNEKNEPVIIPTGRKPRLPGEITLYKGKSFIKTGAGSEPKAVLRINHVNNIIEAEEIVVQRQKDSGSATTEDFKIVNNGTGRAYLHIQTRSSGADPYILLSYKTAEMALKQWVIGMDNSEDDILRWCYKSSGSSPLTPSTTDATEIEMTLSKTGDLSTSGTLTIGSITETTADTNKFLVSDGGVVKYVDDDTLIPDILTAGTNCTLSGSTLNVDDAFIKNDADDIMNGNLTIRKVSDDTNAAELILQKERSDTTIDDDDYVGRVLFKAYDDQGTPEIMIAGEISTQVIDASSNDEKGKMYFKVLADEYVDADNPTIFLTATGIGSGYGNVQVNLGASATTDNFIHGQTKFTASNHGTEATHGKIHLMPFVSGTNPYILIESMSDNGDYFKIQVTPAGQTNITTVDDGGAQAHLNIEPDGHVEFDGCAVGFDKETATFSTSGEIGDGNDSTDVDFRLGNKFELTLTDNISGSSEFINMIFPNTSGNFILVLIQDGTGSRTVASAGWVAYAWDETACDNLAGTNGTDGRLRWAGGSAPTLTTAANGIDIVSIYWDADNQTAFATISQGFA